MAASNLADDWPPLRTITDLALRYWNVRLTCRRCRYERIVSGPALWWLFHRRGWGDDLASAAKKFFCPRCRIADGRKIIPAIGKTRGAPSGDPLPQPDEREWKRLIARYRS